MTRRIAVLVGFVLVPRCLGAAVRGDEVMYVGGTITAVPEKTEGQLEVGDGNVARFTSKKGTFEILLANITSLEYGQKAGRRVGVAIAVSPIALLSKKRKHYLTIGFTDANGNKQGAVLEVAKGRVRELGRTFEARSNKTIEFESDESRKHFEGK